MLLVADVLEVVHLVLARPVGLVARLARLVGVFDRACRPCRCWRPRPPDHRGPEIVEHVAVEADALAGLEPDGPYPHAFVLRHQLAADAGVVALRLALELLLQRLRPLGLLAVRGGLVGHGHRHGIPPVMAGVIYNGFSGQGESGRGRACGGMGRDGRGGEPMRRRALVIGGSMSGLLAALGSRARLGGGGLRAGREQLAGRGAGIVAQPELYAVLRALALDPHDLGVDVPTRRMLAP